MAESRAASAGLSSCACAEAENSAKEANTSEAAAFQIFMIESECDIEKTRREEGTHNSWSVLKNAARSQRRAQGNT
jgi:hypothetical protein